MVEYGAHEIVMSARVCVSDGRAKVRQLALIIVADTQPPSNLKILSNVVELTGKEEEKQKWGQQHQHHHTHTHATAYSHTRHQTLIPHWSSAARCLLLSRAVDREGPESVRARCVLHRRHVLLR